MARQAILVLGIVVVFGIFVPWYKGFDFLDPVMILAYSCLSLLFVAPASAEAFAPDGETRSAMEVLRRIAMVLAYGWGISVLILGAAITTVNLSHWHGSILSPPATLLASSVLLGLTASLAVTGFSALLAQHRSPASAKWAMRVLFLVILAVLAFGRRFLPEQWFAGGLTTAGITHTAFLASAALAAVGTVLVARLVQSPAARG